MNRSYLLIIFLLLSFLSFAQNNEVLYDFDEIPQTLFLNPGSNYSHDYFIGIPILSGININGGVTGVTAYDILADDGVNINTKISNVIYSLENNDSFIINEKTDIISGGVRLNEKDFLSFGLYQELNFTFFFPTDVLQLFYEGTTILDKQYSMDGVNFKADMVGVLHAGISHKVNEKLTIGGRLKLYSSVFNAQTKNNLGQFYTSLGSNNIYQHHLTGVDVTIQTAGLSSDPENPPEPKDYVKRIFTFQNPGIGVDIGFTHKINEQVKITGSVLDIGFVKNSKDVSSYYIRGNYDTEGIVVGFDPGNPKDYWQEFTDDFENRLPIDTVYTSYNSYRPIKINASAKYSFGKKKYEDCFKYGKDDSYLSAVGIQFFSVNRVIKQQFAATLFYERRLGKRLRTKVTYTLDSYSSSNIGLGLSSKFGSVSLYMALNNLLYTSNLAKANSTAFQFGLNIILDKKNP